jgi:hypothetical protein
LDENWTAVADRIRFDYYRNGTASCEPLNHNGVNRLGVNR